MNSADSFFQDKVEQWISEDPDPKTRAELQQLLEQSFAGDLTSRITLEGLFVGRLRFGTAGIRGPLQPGPAGMNRVVTAQTTAGLARYLLEKHSGYATGRLRAVVGCDARTNSAIFAQDTAAIFAGYGIEATLLPEELPTPVLAFAVRYLEADVGVMVTASHNPPQDNGYKVYLGGAHEGSQIIPPVDRAIEQQIVEVAETMTWDQIPYNRGAVTQAPSSVVDDYITATVSSVAPIKKGLSTIPVVYTAMHGVGARTFFDTVGAAGFPAVIPVIEQTSPDPAFPTVAFPNPEEAGALDLSFATARKNHARAILAHDPDADRLAVALAHGDDYVALTGNQVGAILGWHCATRATRAGVTGVLANSLVSSPVLGKIARHFGLDHEETLTGFKYVSRVPGLIFGFEEALGYLVSPDVLRDKDGNSAGLMVLELIYDLDAEGKTLWHYLQTIEESVGGFASSQVTIALSEAVGGNSLPTQLRKNPPSTIGGRSVTTFDDFLDGTGDFLPENILRYYLEDESRIIIRPSGTEPKLKIYLDTQGPKTEDAEESLTALEADMRALIASF